MIDRILTVGGITLLSRVTGNLVNFDQVLVYRLSLGALEVATVGLLWWLLRRLRPDDESPMARL